MDSKHKITIPKPCHEDWNKMTPKDNGRFCGSCSKNVVDFTNMLPDEIQMYFQQHSNVCGRFKNSQLDSLTIQIPNRVLHSQTHYHKMFLLALFIAMGTTLFSCSDKNGNKQKIDKIEIINEPKPETDRIWVGDVKYDPNDTLNIPPPPPPPRLDQVKFVNPIEKNQNKSKNDKVKFYPPQTISCGEITNIKSNSSGEAIEDETIVLGMVVPEIQPNFPGGITQFLTFFGNEFNRPESITAANSKIRISFAVEKDGSLTYIESTNPIDEILETEIIRVLKLSPKWEPGESNGKKIRMTYSLPIVFQ
jgi:hypothetical protein